MDAEKSCEVGPSALLIRSDERRPASAERSADAESEALFPSEMSVIVPEALYFLSPLIVSNAVQSSFAVSPMRTASAFCSLGTAASQRFAVVKPLSMFSSSASRSYSTAHCAPSSHSTVRPRLSARKRTGTQVRPSFSMGEVSSGTVFSTLPVALSEMVRVSPPIAKRQTLPPSEAETVPPSKPTSAPSASATARNGTMVRPFSKNG